MGDPVRLVCRMCGDGYYIHPANEKPIPFADLCPTCETFQLGMMHFYEDSRDEKDRRVTGWLVVGLSALCVVAFILWLIFGG